MQKQHGFTLIDLLIAVLIVGILAAIAYPNYTAFVQKSRRADAKVELMSVAARLQRCFTTNNTFTAAAGACALKDTLEVDGVSSPNNYYTITGSAFTATAYVLTATPNPAMAQSKDKTCASFTLNEKGQKSAVDINGVVTKDKCWK